MPIVEVFTHHRRPFLIAVGLKISEIAWASIAGVFVISYATGKLGLPRSAGAERAADRHRPWRCSPSRCSAGCPTWSGRKTMFLASCAVLDRCSRSRCSGCSTPSDPAIVTLPSWSRISFGQMVVFGIGAPWYSELFDARLRYSGASLGFQVGAALSGGLTPLIAASLMAWAAAPPGRSRCS